MPNNQFSLEEVISQLTNNELPNNALKLTNIFTNPTPVPFRLGKFVSHYNDETLHALAAAVTKNTTMERLELSNIDSSCVIEWTAEGAQALGNALKNHPTLKSVMINIKASNEILGFLNCLTGSAPIQDLAIEFYCEQVSFLAELSGYLKKNKTLNAISLTSKLFLYKASNTNSNNLNELIKGLTQNKQLVSLSLDSISLSDNDFICLAENLSPQSLLKHLTLNMCKLTPSGLKLLSPFFKKAESLVYLDLSHNFLDASGIYCLTTYLREMPKLQTLKLNAAKLDKNSALKTLLTGLIEFNCPVKELHIGIHQFTVADMTAVNTFIIESSFIKILSMIHCQLNDKHLEALKDTLANPDVCHLEELQLSGNSSKSNFNLFPKILNSNPHLCSLKLSIEYPSQLQLALEMNKARRLLSQRTFINGVITLAQGFFGGSTKKNQPFVFSVPKEIMLLIMMKAGRHTLGLTPLQVQECCLLIFQNFGVRANLKKTQEKVEFTQWWSQTTRNDEKKPLFTRAKPEKDSTKCTIM